MSYQKYIGLFFLLIAATTVDAQKQSVISYEG